MVIRTTEVNPKRDRVRIARLNKPLTPAGIRVFQSIIYSYYREHGRSFPWRETTKPYRILVSEVMLQQTQTDRVVQKYTDFIKTFPDFIALAKASLRKILAMWMGLGYNRRALALKKIAEIIVSQYGSRLPADEQSLLQLPGIGKGSAAAILAFAFNQPSIFVETNIRTVFNFLFFTDENVTHDRHILPLVKRTLDSSNPREWYYALFDYGAMLKKTMAAEVRQSRSARQTPFNGSDRQIRGMIVKMLLNHRGKSESDITKQLATDPERVRRILERLQQEGFIVNKGGRLSIA